MRSPLVAAALIVVLAGCGGGKSDTSACNQVIAPLKDQILAVKSVVDRTATTSDVADRLKTDSAKIRAAGRRASSPTLKAEIDRVSTDVLRIRVDLLDRTADQTDIRALIADYEALFKPCPKSKS